MLPPLRQGSVFGKEKNPKNNSATTFFPFSLEPNIDSQNKVRQEITLSSPLSHGSRTVPSTSSTPNSKGAGSSTPNKPIDTSAYLQKMYADMEKVDKQLELVAKIEGKKADIAKFDEEEDEDMDYSDTMEVDITKEMTLGENDDKLRKMEDMMKDLNQQSDEIHKMFRYSVE